MALLGIILGVLCLLMLVWIIISAQPKQTKNEEKSDGK
jgi:hypothetical protein